MSIGVNSLVGNVGVLGLSAVSDAIAQPNKRKKEQGKDCQQTGTIDDQNHTTSHRKDADRAKSRTMTVQRETADGTDETSQSAPKSERDIDQALVERVQAGDSRAFDALVIKYQQRVIQLVSRLVNDADAPDVAQEAFIKAYRALPNFRGQSAFYTWLYRIAINTAKNFLVSRKRRPLSQDIDVQDAELYGHTEHLSDNSTPEARLLSEEIRQVVAETIAGLPPDLRRAISLREFDGLSYEDIALAMDCPVGTVRSRIFRARAAVDEKLKPLLEQV